MLPYGVERGSMKLQGPPAFHSGGVSASSDRLAPWKPSMGPSVASMESKANYGLGPPERIEYGLPLKEEKQIKQKIRRLFW